MSEQTRIETNVSDEWTLKLEKLLLDIASTANQNNKKYYFGGGFAIDLALGKLTRIHEDIDFHPFEEDTEFWKEWFKSKGYTLSKDPDMEPYPNAFLPTNENKDYFADVYPIKIEANGDISMGKSDGEYSKWYGKTFNTVKKVNYKDVEIYIEDPRTVIEQKLKATKEEGLPFQEKHRHDLDLYNEFLKGDHEPLSF